MAATNFTPIQLYNSSTAAATPLAANLANGELAINIADGKLYYKDSGGVVQLLASSSGASGNVVGPASSTDNAISRFDGTTGKLIQNSVVTIADTTGNMAGVGTLGVGAITTSGALVGAVSQDAFNTVSTTLNLGGAATTVNIGAATGTLTVANATLAAKALTATAITNSALTATRLVYSGTAGLEVDSANLTFNGTDLTVSGAVNAGSINATTLDLTNLEVTNIKAKDGTASIDLADTTGIATFSKATVISTTDNTNAALRITQLGTGNALLVEDETNPDSTPFVIDASGTVIVGSTAALTNGVVQTFKLDNIASNDLIRKNTAGSGTVISGDTVGNLRFYGFDGTNYTRTAHIFSAVDGTPGVNDMPGRLVFSTTADGSATPTERMRISSTGQTTISGNAIISVTDNTNAALRITQLGTGNALLVEDETNPDSTPFVIDATGRLIIGGTAATASYAYGSSAKLQLQNSYATLSQYSANTSGNVLDFLKSRSATIGTQTIVQTGDVLGGFYASGSDGVAFIPAAQILAQVDGTPGTNDMPGRLVFATTADGASTTTERMRIDNAGRVGIGGTPAAGQTLSLTKSVTGAVTSNVLNNAGTIASDVTTTARGYFSSFGTAAAAFTLTTLEHFRANQSTIGATSAVTQQFGFNADSTLTGATTNYGFYSAIAAGTNRYNFYAAGTADNYFNGSIGIGDVPSTNVAFSVTKLQTGSASGTTISVRLNPAADVTTNSIGVGTFAINGVGTSTTNFTHYNANQGTFAGTAPTNQFGFNVSNALTGATNNFGVYSNIASGTNRWNLYANGTARNYMAADLTVNGATAIPAGGTAGAGLMVSTTANFGVFFGSGAPTLSAAKGSLYLRSDGSTVNDRMYVNTNGSTTWTSVVTSA